MHKLKIKNHLSNLKNLAIVAALLSYVLFIPATALAASDAQKACDGSKNAGTHGLYTDSSSVNSCEAGFNGGKAKKNRDTACKNYTSDDLDACYFGFGKGACSIDNPDQTD